MTIRNISKTDLKHSSKCKMKTFLKHHRKHCANVCVGRLKTIYFNNNRLLIRCSTNMFCLKKFKNINQTSRKHVFFYKILRHFQNIF